MSALESLEDELRDCIAEASAALQRASATGVYGAQKQQHADAAARELTDAERLLARLQQQARNFPSQQRRIADRCAKYDGDLQSLRRQQRSLVGAGAGAGASASASSRQWSNKSAASGGGGGGGGGDQRGLFSGGPEDVEAQARDQRSRVLAGYDHLDNTTETITNARRIAAETEQIGVEVIGQIGEQNDALVRVRDRTEDIEDNMSRSKRIVRRMAWRAVTNRLLLAVLIVLLLGAIAAVIYLKFFR